MVWEMMMGFDVLLMVLSVMVLVSLDGMLELFY